MLKLDDLFSVGKPTLFIILHLQIYFALATASAQVNIPTLIIEKLPISPILVYFILNEKITNG